MCFNQEKIVRNESCIWEKKGKNLPSPWFSELPYRFFFYSYFHFANQLFVQCHTTPIFGRFLTVWYCSTHPRGNGFMSRAKVRSWKFMINECSNIILQFILWILLLSRWNLLVYVCTYSKELHGRFFPLWELNFCSYSSSDKPSWWKGVWSEKCITKGEKGNTFSKLLERYCFLL